MYVICPSILVQKRCTTSLGSLGQSGRYDSECLLPLSQSLLCHSHPQLCINMCTLRLQMDKATLHTPVSIACRGVSKETRGTAYIVYEDIYDAKTAVEHLSGFNVANRYLIVLYYNTAKQNKKASVASAFLPCPALPCPGSVSGIQSSKQACASEPPSFPAGSLNLQWLTAQGAVSAGEHQGEGGGAEKDAGEVWRGWGAACAGAGAGEERLRANSWDATQSMPRKAQDGGVVKALLQRMAWPVEQRS